MWLWLGDVWYEQVISSHAGEVVGLDKGNIVKFFVRHDWALVLGIATWLLVRKKVSSRLVLPMLAILAFVVLWHDFYYLYLKILVVWLALWWGWVVSELGKKYEGREFLAAIMVGLVVVSGISVSRYLDEQAEAAVIGPLDEVVEYVKSRTEGNDPLYGTFEITPLVALGAERPIWRNMVDTNTKFFQTNWFDYEERGGELKQDKVPVIITKALLVKGGRMAAGPERVLPRKFFNENCRIGKIWPVENDYSHNAVVVWMCEYKN